MQAKTAPRRTQAAERRRQALKLRQCGYTFEAIGRYLGIGRPAAYRLVKKALETLEAESLTEARELRTLELARLDALQAALAPDADRGHAQAVLATLRVMDQRARLLGLYAPTRTALTDPEGHDAMRGLASLLRQAEKA